MPGKIAIVAAAVALLGVVASGCGSDDEDGPVVLPPVTPSPTPTAGMTDKQQITWIYKDYHARANHAQDLGTAQWRGYLSQWLVDPGLRYAVKGYRSYRDRQLKVYGHRVPHIGSVKIHGHKAVLRSCVDIRHVTVKHVDTGKIIRNKHDSTRNEVKFRKTRNGWRMYDSDGKYRPCLD